MLRFAFYGRVSTEDQQDPESSRSWQLHRSQQLIQPHGGIFVAEYFDCGHSRSLPWTRRPEASRLLAALRHPDRNFTAVVIGEPQRAFYGNQFSLTFPIFTHYGVELWVPEVGGRIDPGSDAHDLVMTLFGGMSKGERNRIKTRVRAAMSAQTTTQGRFLGGRPPYGYRLVDAGPHPHPTKAALGGRLHRLEPDPLTAPVVERIFQEYLDGHGYYAIAERLTADAVPSPAGHDPARNPHRHGRAWGKSAVRAILGNPRYTGYQVWGRQRRDEVLLDVGDVAAGHTSRRRWNPTPQWIWSAEPAHQPLISRETFQAVQARMHPATTPTPRKARPDARVYPLRGRLRCQLCDRRLQGQWIHGEAYYRCRYPTEYATAAGFDHPRSVNLREADLLPQIDAWLGQLTDPDHLQATCQAIASASDQHATRSAERAAARQLLADCDRRLARYRAALEAGTDPTVVGQWIAEVTATRQAAETSLHQLAAAPDPVSPEAIRRALEAVGGLAAALDGADPGLRAQLYQEVGIEGTYDPHARIVAVRADLRRRMVRVGGGT